MELWLVLFMSEGQGLEKKTSLLGKEKISLLAVSKAALFDQRRGLSINSPCIFFVSSFN